MSLYRSLTPRTKGWVAYFASVLLIPLTLSVFLLAIMGDYVLIGVVVSVLLFGVGILLYNYGESLLAPTVKEVLEKDTRPPVIFLRPFEKDLHFVEDQEVIFIDPSGTRSTRFEELLTPLNSLGPLISIADPSTKGRFAGTHHGGAYREYVSVDDWQARVTELLRKATLAVLIVGQSDGITWEFAQARKLLLPQSILLCLPDVMRISNKSSYEHIYRDFTEQFKRIFGSELPPLESATYFIGFDPQGSPFFPDISEEDIEKLSKNGFTSLLVSHQLNSVLHRLRPDVKLRRQRLIGTVSKRWRLGILILFGLTSIPLSILLLVVIWR